MSQRLKGGFNKPGVITSSNLTFTPSDSTQRRLDSLYARHYSLANDLALILRFIGKLDNRAA
jgi:hypothetical protein